VLWKTTVTAAWVGTHDKVRSCPPVVGIFVVLLSAVEGEDGPCEHGRQRNNHRRLN